MWCVDHATISRTKMFVFSLSLASSGQGTQWSVTAQVNGFAALIILRVGFAIAQAAQNPVCFGEWCVYHAFCVGNGWKYTLQYKTCSLQV
jgi:hypothetical protein